MFSLFRCHREEGKVCRQSNLCEIKPDINWDTDPNPEIFLCRTGAQTSLWSHRLIWDLANWYLILLHNWGQFHHKSVRSLTQNSPLALYFPFMSFWSNRSKFLFGRRCKESKGEHLLDTSSNHRPIWKVRTGAISASTHTEGKCFCSYWDPHHIQHFDPRAETGIYLQPRVKPQPSWEQWGVCWQETLRRVMCFALDHTLYNYKQHREDKHCSPPLWIQEPKGIRGTLPASGSKANKQKQFSKQLKIKLCNVLPLELQTSEGCTEFKKLLENFMEGKSTLGY